MQIKTKFNIGDRVWIVEEFKGIVSAYSDIIESYNISKDGNIPWFKESDAFDVKEEELIAYEDKESLIQKIYKVDKTLIKKEEDNV